MRQAIATAPMFARHPPVSGTAQITKGGIHAWQSTADGACLHVGDQVSEVINLLAQPLGNAGPVRAAAGGLLAPPLPIAVVLGLAVYFGDPVVPSGRAAPSMSCRSTVGQCASMVTWRVECAQGSVSSVHARSKKTRVIGRRPSLPVAAERIAGGSGIKDRTAAPEIAATISFSATISATILSDDISKA